jgi:hypothetical protein
MQGSALPFLGSWQNFYMIIGTAAATLTGLVFVAMTLVVGLETHESTLNAGIAIFNSPTVVHFCVVVLLAVVLSSPWEAFSILALLLGLVGLGVALYLINIMRRMRQAPLGQTALKDWLWYMIFPLVVYVALIGSALTLPANPALALYLVSAVMIALLFIGIHNAWDLVTFLAVKRSHSAE